MSLGINWLLSWGCLFWIEINKINRNRGWRFKRFFKRVFLETSLLPNQQARDDRPGMECNGSGQTDQEALTLFSS
jgi:hypothetical protein